MNRATIMGAGPIGLDAALALQDAGWSVRVHEAADEVGAHVRAWGHVRLFTPWSMCVSPRMRAHLGAEAPDAPGTADGDRCPTGHELVERLLVPSARVLGGAVRTGSTVLSVSRRGQLKSDGIGARRGAFRLLVADREGEHSEDADLVVDATGSYGRPVFLGDGGGPAPGERALGPRVLRHLPDVAAERDRWAGRRVLLVGAGKSAQTAARDLVGAASEVTWLVRDPDPDWGEVPDDSLPARQELVDLARAAQHGELGGVRVRAGMQVEALRPLDDGRIAVTVRGGAGAGAGAGAGGGAGEVPDDEMVVDEMVVDEMVVDEVVALTGYAADTRLYGELQVHECYATGAPMALSAALLAAAGAGSGGSAGDGPVDCLAQPALGVDALRSPEPDFFVLGAKSYGRNSAFLLRVGYEQVDEVAAAYALAAR